MGEKSNPTSLNGVLRASLDVRLKDLKVRLALKKFKGPKNLKMGKMHF
jgi:hypothetical protein